MLSSFAHKSKSTRKRASSDKSKRASTSIWSSSSCGGAGACFGFLSSSTSVESQVVLVLDHQSNHKHKHKQKPTISTTTTPTKLELSTNDDEARAVSPATCATQPTTSSSPLSFQDLFSSDIDDSSSSSTSNSSDWQDEAQALQDDDLMILQEFCRIKSPFLLKLEQVNWERKHQQTTASVAPSLAQELQRIQSEQQERLDEAAAFTSTCSILATQRPDPAPLEEEEEEEEDRSFISSSSSSESSSSSSSTADKNSHNSHNDNDNYNPQFIPKPTTSEADIVGMEFNVVSDHNIAGSEQDLLQHANLQRLKLASATSSFDNLVHENETAGATTSSLLLLNDENIVGEKEEVTIMKMEEETGVYDDEKLCLLQASTAGIIQQQQQGEDGTHDNDDEIEIVFYRDDVIHVLENASSLEGLAQEDDHDEVILWELLEPAAADEESCLENNDLDGSFFTSRQETSTVRSGTSASSTVFLDAHETLSASFVSSTASIGSPTKESGRSTPTTTDKTTTTTTTTTTTVVIPKQLSMDATEQEQPPPPYRWYHPDHVDVPQGTRNKHSVHEFLRRRQAQQEQDQKQEFLNLTNDQDEIVVVDDNDEESNDEIRSWCGVSTGSCPSSAVQTLVQLCSNAATPQKSSKSQPQSSSSPPIRITWWSILQLHGENTAAVP